MAQDLDLICQGTGFLLLEDHGVAEHIVSAQWEVVTEFFASSASKKQKSLLPMLVIPMAGWDLIKRHWLHQKGKKRHLILRKASMAAL